MEQSITLPYKVSEVCPDYRLHKSTILCTKWSRNGTGNHLISLEDLSCISTGAAWPLEIQLASCHYSVTRR